MELNAMHLNYVIYENLLLGNGGLLSRERPQHAAWHYCVLAHKALSTFDAGRIYVEDKNLEVDLPAIARAVATLYGLESPAEYVGFLGLMRQQARISGLLWDKRVENPKIKVVLYASH